MRSATRLSWFVLLLFGAVSIHTLPVHAQPRSDDAGEQRILSLGSMLFGIAWPTAEYESVSLNDVRYVDGGTDVVLRLSGTGLRSNFTHGRIWADLVLEIRNGSIHDLRWGRHNALVDPGATMSALGEVLLGLTEEYSKSRAPRNAAFLATNSCRHRLQLAISYVDARNAWRTIGWWQLDPGARITLEYNGAHVRSSHPVWYYYAETTDGSRLEWRGSDQVTIGDRTVLMRREENKGGNFELDLTCPS